MRRGHLIVLEGIDGAGKTTQWNNLKAYLGEENYLFVREPGSTPAGEAIRELLTRTDLTGEERILLFTVARSTLVRNVIAPALAQGRHVICDRYLPSMLAYQGWNTGITKEAILSLFKCTGGIWPDLVVYLELHPRTALSRLEDRPADGLDPRNLGFLKSVWLQYLELGLEPENHFYFVDADRAVDKVFTAVVTAISEFQRRRDHE